MRGGGNICCCHCSGAPLVVIVRAGCVAGALARKKGTREYESQGCLLLNYCIQSNCANMTHRLPHGHISKSVQNLQTLQRMCVCVCQKCGLPCCRAAIHKEGIYCLCTNNQLSALQQLVREAGWRWMDEGMEESALSNSEVVSPISGAKLGNIFDSLSESVILDGWTTRNQHSSFFGI